MKILRIERQKKDRNRYSIFSEAGFEKGITEDTLVKFGLRAGDALDDEKFKEIVDFDDFISARKDAYEFIAYKPRTSSEVAKKLKSRKYDEATIARITTLLTEQKYLDDLGYAISYASEKIRSKPIGRELIRRKLLQKGIDKELIEQASTGLIAGDDETDIARKALEKYVLKQNETDFFKLRNKCFRHLVSRGFSIDTASSVTESFLKERI
jgi:regulatory protein